MHGTLCVHIFDVDQNAWHFHKVQVLSFKKQQMLCMKNNN